MSDTGEAKKITQLRTFASDAKQARLKMPEENTPKETTMQTEVKSTTKIDTNFQEKSNTLKAEMAQVGKNERGSILSDTGLTYESEGTTDGIIIRDKRRKRFKLFPAMVEASTSWFTKVQDDHQKKLDSIPKIKSAESRIEIIEEAVKGSEQAPKEDYALVAEHLKKTERVPISTAISFKEKSAVPEPKWSSLEDQEEIQIIEAPAVAEVAPTLIPEVVVEAVPAKAVPSPIIEDAPTHMEVTDVREHVIDTALDTLFDSKVDPLPTEVPVIEVVQPTEIIIPEVIKEQEVKEPQRDEVVYVAPVETPIVPRVQYAPPKDSRTKTSLYMYLFIGVVIVSSLCGVLVTYYIFSLAETTPSSLDEQEIQTVSPSLLQEQSSKTYIMPTTATAHILEIERNIQSTQAVTRLIPNLQKDASTREATTEEILASLTLSAPPSFVRSIKEVNFGTVDGNDLFIVLKVSTFDTAFAGMLAWEESIQSDFSPLFNTNQSRADAFTDTLVSNKNTRLLKDVNNEDVLTYTFTNKNTILITSTRTVLERLIPLVK